MNKAVKNTIAIIIIIILSVSLGYAYDKILTVLEKRSHPIPEMYKETVEKYSEEYNVPQDLIYSVIKAESGFRSDAVSPSAGAVGLMQIMPATFADIAKRLGEAANEGLLYDPHTNIKYGTFYLRYLYDMFNEWDLAVAAYNAGLSRVNGWLKNPEYIIDNEIVYIPIEETRNYLKRVNKNREVYKKLYFNNNSNT
jgi:soluble lytic murein transglycosylase